MPKIKGVYGIPYGEEQDGATVGTAWQCSRIEVREQNLGTYGIMWYDVYNLEGQLKSSFNAAGVQSVTYFPEEKPETE